MCARGCVIHPLPSTRAHVSCPCAPRARVTVEEILQLKQQEAERQKLKAKLSKQINANDLFDLE